MSRADEVVSAHVAAELYAENKALRRLLAVFHKCGATVNFTPGEATCPGVENGHAPIDFVRDHAARIEELLTEPSLRFIQEHQDDVCKHCRAGRWTFDQTRRQCPAPQHEWVSVEDAYPGTPPPAAQSRPERTD